MTSQLKAFSIEIKDCTDDTEKSYMAFKDDLEKEDLNCFGYDQIGSNFIAVIFEMHSRKNKNIELSPDLIIEKAKNYFGNKVTEFNRMFPNKSEFRLKVTSESEQIDNQFMKFREELYKLFLLVFEENAKSYESTKVLVVEGGSDIKEGAIDQILGLAKNIFVNAKVEPFTKIDMLAAIRRAREKTSLSTYAENRRLHKANH